MRRSNSRPLALSMFCRGELYQSDIRAVNFINSLLLQWVLYKIKSIIFCCFQLCCVRMKEWLIVHFQKINQSIFSISIWCLMKNKICIFYYFFSCIYMQPEENVTIQINKIYLRVFVQLIIITCIELININSFLWTIILL